MRHLTAWAALLFAPPVWSQGLEYVKANYTKYEYRIPMRDGKRLFTAVYVPKDASQKYPILLNRTPYSVAPYGADRYKENIGPSALMSKEAPKDPASLAAKEGYIIVYQDVRGRWMSEGEHVNMRPHLAVKRGPTDIDESTDTWDTIDWLVKNIPDNNGRVGTWGISYPGFYTAAGMIDAHPAHKAASPQAPIVDWFTGDDFHRNGAVYLPHAFNFMARFGRPRPEPTEKGPEPFDHGTPDGYQFFLRMGPIVNANEKYFKNDIAFWNEMMKHGSYDEFWQSRNLRPHMKAIRPAVLTVGGWFDAENLYGALETYKAVEKSTPGGVNHIAMGPWRHGGWASEPGDSLGDIQFNSKTSLFYREKIELAFFNFHLKEKPGPKLPEAYMFETGTNVWRALDAWPPRNTQPRSLYFLANGKLAFTEPKEDNAFDEYVSDPSKPVPYAANTAIGMTREHMLDDQRFAATRPDVLVYESDVLENDLTIAGPLRPALHVSTTGTDSDWIVKLIDVYPGNFDDPKPAEECLCQRNPHPVRMGDYQQLVRGEVFRGKFRNSFEKPEPFEPGKRTKVEYEMNDIYHTFRRGHRIMVQVQSTWFPLVDRNPQKFMDINVAKETDFQKATQRVYRSRGAASQVKVLVAPRPL